MFGFKQVLLTVRCGTISTKSHSLDQKVT